MKLENSQSNKKKVISGLGYYTPHGTIPGDLDIMASMPLILEFLEHEM